jgi:hypothetical protein
MNNDPTLQTAATREDFLALTAQIKQLNDCVMVLAAATLMPSNDGKLNTSIKAARLLLKNIHRPISDLDSPYFSPN